MVADDTPRSRAAAGRAGTKMCSDSVPQMTKVKISHSGGRPAAEASSGARSRFMPG